MIWKALFRSSSPAYRTRTCITIVAQIAALEFVGDYERAALTALFSSGAHPAYQELGRAVRCLERGGAASAASAPERAAALRMMAMVVAGYQPVGYFARQRADERAGICLHSVHFAMPLLCARVHVHGRSACAHAAPRSS